MPNGEGKPDYDVLLDCRNDDCSMVINRLAALMNTMMAGDVLKLIASCFCKEEILSWCDNPDNHAQFMDMFESDEKGICEYFIRRL